MTLWLLLVMIFKSYLDVTDKICLFSFCFADADWCWCPEVSLLPLPKAFIQEKVQTPQFAPLWPLRPIMAAPEPNTVFLRVHSHLHKLAYHSPNIQTLSTYSIGLHKFNKGIVLWHHWGLCLIFADVNESHLAGFFFFLVSHFIKSVYLQSALSLGVP